MAMKSRISHKEITLLLGIVVAAIVIFTLWVRNPVAPTGRITNPVMPSLKIPPATPVLKTASEVLRQLRIAR